MADTKISALTAASNLTGATVPIVQGGANKKAGIALWDAIYQPLDSDLTAIAALTTQALGRSLLTAVNAAAAISILGLGTMATQNANAVAITGGTLAGITSLAMVDVTGPSISINRPNLSGVSTGSSASVGKGAFYAETVRVSGDGQYGNLLVLSSITDATPSPEFDVGITAWTTNRNLTGGQVFGMWAGANTPSNSLGQTFSGGAAIGLEVNAGNRWADFGLQTDTGGTRYTVGLQIVADVVPASDGSTASIYPGSFGTVVAASNGGHKWWVGSLVREDAIMPGGYLNIDNGGSSAPNAVLAHTSALGFYTDGIDFTGATVSGSAFKSDGFAVDGDGDVTLKSVSITGAGAPPAIGLAAPTANELSLYARSLLAAQFQADASAVNYMQITAKAAGTGPFFIANGSDTDIDLNFGAKGTGGRINFRTNVLSTFETQFRILHTASASRMITVTGSNGGNPTLSTSAGNLAITPAVVAANAVKSTHATAGIGYDTGAGGAVTQATSRTTGVTLDKICGAITLVSAAGSATFASFTVTNSAVAATDTIVVNQKSGTDLYEIHVTAVAAGSFRITFRTTGGTTTEQPVLNFAVIKAVAA